MVMEGHFVPGARTGDCYGDRVEKARFFDVAGGLCEIAGDRVAPTGPKPEHAGLANRIGWRAVPLCRPRSGGTAHRGHDGRRSPAKARRALHAEPLRYWMCARM